MTAVGIREALSKFGTPEEVVDVAALVSDLECFEGIPWEPQYVCKVGGHLWGVDAPAQLPVSETHLVAMADAQARCPDFHSAVLAPDPYIAAQAARQVGPKGIAVIYPRGTAWAVLAPRMATPVPPLPRQPTRIPEELADRVGTLTAIDPSFGSVLLDFSRAHRELRLSHQHSDDAEAALLMETLESLAAPDERFVGGASVLQMLRDLEKYSSSSGSRDHFFHTFQNFLLGMCVLNDAYELFRQSLEATFPEFGSDMSPEYVWLLTSLFHDVGYTASRSHEIADLVFGPRSWDGSMDEEEHAAVAERMERLTDETHRTSRRILASLFDHLRQATIRGDWSAEAFPSDAYLSNPFDQAVVENFSSGGHGAASCFRLCIAIGSKIFGTASADTRRLLERHALVAAISIPLHDWRFRESLGKHGVTVLDSSRFRFATLLAFIDSIQDDRRELSAEARRTDILVGLKIDLPAVSAVIDPTGLDEAFLASKRIEAGSLQAFFSEDERLRYVYPSEYLG